MDSTHYHDYTTWRLLLRHYNLHYDITASIMTTSATATTATTAATTTTADIFI